MSLLLNTANPILIISIVLIISGIIIICRKLEVAWPLIIVMICIVGYMIYHSILLDNLEKESALLRTVYHCIAFDLMYMLISFISYLWIDSIIAKKKKLKSYDDSLNWFWDKL